MNVEQTKLTLKFLPPRQSILIIGRHGLGKSQVVAQTTRELSMERGTPYEFIDIRLSQREVGDIIGMPRRSDTFEVVRTVYKDGSLVEVKETVQNVSLNDLPLWFPQDPDSHGILFLDELDRATRDVQQAAFEAVLDYRMNLHHIPIGWRVVSAINGDQDVYSVQQIDPALLDRFLVINFRPTVPEWLDWAKGKSPATPANLHSVDDARWLTEDRQIHDAVIKYISKHSSDLDTPEAIEPGLKVYQSRRSWVLFSNTIHYMKACGKDILKDLDYLLLLASGYIGTTLASNFMSFVQKDYKVYTPEDILNKWGKEMEDDLERFEPAEIVFYGKELAKYIGENKVKLSKRQSENLKKFYFAIPKEAASAFWSDFTANCRDEATKWYRSDPEITKRTLALVRKKDALS